MPPKQKQKKGPKKGSKKGKPNSLPTGPSKDPSPVTLSQDIIAKIIDDVSSNIDLKSCSLVSRAWAHRSQQKLFQHIILAPADVEPWLRRTNETITKMAPWITKFELRASTNGGSDMLPWANPALLTRLIGSLASSPIQHLTIIPFHMGRYRKVPLVRCFEPITNSLRSLELRFLRTCVQALTFLISMFPHLDDIFLERVNPIHMTWAHGGHDFEHTPSFAGIFEYLDFDAGTRLAFLRWITGFPLRFHTISPDMLTKDDIIVFRRLLVMCAPTLREIPHVMFDAGIQPVHLRAILSPCTNLRRVGVAGAGYYQMPILAETMLLSLTSRHISVIYLEMVGTLRTLYIHQIWNDEGWRRFDDFLCQLAEGRIDDREPLVLELGIWRNPLLKTYGPLDPGRILPRFRERGLMRFAEPPEDKDYAAVLESTYSDENASVNPMLPNALMAFMGQLLGG